MIETINNNVLKINRSPYFLAMMILIVNIGSKYLDINFGFTSVKFFSSEIMKLLVLFAICYTATRDLYISLIVTAIFLFMFEHLFHEESSMCIVPAKYRSYKNPVKKVVKNTNLIYVDDINEAIRVLTKAKMNKECVKQNEIFEKFRYYTNI